MFHSAGGASSSCSAPRAPFLRPAHFRCARTVQVQADPGRLCWTANRGETLFGSSLNTRSLSRKKFSKKEEDYGIRDGPGIANERAAGDRLGESPVQQ